MCGITGFWNSEGVGPEAEEQLKQMTQTLYHRGPDGFGHWLDKESGVGMAHARLSIIDLSGGHQPIFSRNRQQVLTMNGELYDYQATRARLACQGRQFQTKSDSETALHLYDLKGLDFVNDLRGEFAIALFEQSAQRLVLIRDRFGVKPLYFYFNGELLVYGSEIKSVLTHPSVPRELCPKAALHQLMHTMVPGTSAFKDVYTLKPGHMLIVERQGNGLSIRETQYWDMNFPTEADHGNNHTSEADLVAQVRESLIRSVELRLNADVPVGCYLSGGIDSCSILGIATNLRQNPVKAFTISFDHDSYDESAIAREMAEFTGADQEMIALSETELYGENYVKTMWHAERTFYNTLGVAKWCMSRRVHECGYKVVITGEGSDELFGGYPSFKRDMFLHGLSPETSAGYQQQLNQSNQVFTGAILSEETVSHPAFESLCGFTPSWIQPWMLTLALARPLLNNETQQLLRGYDPIAAIVETISPDQLADRHPLDKAQYTWIKTMLEGQILTWGGDRVDMANSMESRPAFLDHHVAHVAKHVPPHLRIKDGVEKWVLREAMKGVLPEVLYKREKFAFMAPPGNTNEAKQKALKALLHHHMQQEQIEAAGLLDADRVQVFVEQYFRETDPVRMKRQDALMNHLLGIHLLHQHFVSQKIPQPV